VQEWVFGDSEVEDGRMGRCYDVGCFGGVQYGGGESYRGIGSCAGGDGRGVGEVLGDSG